jgi:hypothetical protein
VGEPLRVHTVECAAEREDVRPEAEPATQEGGFHGQNVRAGRQSGVDAAAADSGDGDADRTLILDIIPRDGTGRGCQSLSEVRLALWTKAGLLVPGETVNVYWGSGGASELLIGSPQRGRAFLGTVESPVGPPAQIAKVSGVILVDWAAWAASTTFSFTRRGFAYERREVDALRSAVRDAFLGVSEPAVRSDEVRGKQFSTAHHRLGYDKTQVEAFVEAAGLRLAAMESTDRPEGPLVSGDILAGWAEWADSTTFSKPSWRKRGYMALGVDTFQGAIRDTFLGVRKPHTLSASPRHNSKVDDSWARLGLSSLASTSLSTPAF